MSGTMARLIDEKETPVHHRAFLLYAMQQEGRRNLRLVGRILSRSESGLRKVMNRRRWKERIQAAGPGADVLAVREYSKHYSATLVHDASQVEKRMAIPFRPELLPPDPEVEGTIGGPASRAQAAAELHAGTPKAQEKKTQLDRFLTLIEGTLIRAQEQVVAGKMKVSARDLPVLMRAYHELKAMGDGTTLTMGGPEVVPSTRMRIAERTGGSQTEALLGDAEECVAILAAIKESETIAAEVAEIRRSNAEQAEETPDADADPDADSEAEEELELASAK